MQPHIPALNAKTYREGPGNKASCNTSVRYRSRLASWSVELLWKAAIDYV